MRHDRTEGEAYPTNNFIYGRNPGKNGWYLILRLKWFKTTKEVYSPHTFNLYNTECYKAIGYVYRKPTGFPFYKLFNISAWLPSTDWAIIEVK
jgi:hypothetical protein